MDRLDSRRHYRVKRPSDLDRILDFKHQKLHIKIARGARGFSEEEIRNL